MSRGNTGTLGKAAGNTGTLGKGSREYRTPPVVVPPQVNINAMCAHNLFTNY